MASKQKEMTKAERKRRKRKRMFLRIHRFFVTLSIFFLFALVAYRFYDPISAATPAMATLVGFESGGNHQRKEGVYHFLLTGSDDGHGNADTIIVVQYDTVEGNLNLISVPRDTLVYRTWSSFPKLNSAMSKGIEVLKEEISSTLGIPLDFYVQIGLDAFIAVVDELGGIDYDVPQDMYHDDEGGFIIDLQAGQQWLDGRKTLELVRYRGYASADIGRTQTQQAVLKILAEKLISWNSFSKMETFISIFQQYVNTDLSNSDFLWFAKSVLSNKDLKIYTQTLEGRGDAVVGSYRWCYELDKEKTLFVVNTYLNPYTTNRISTDLNIRSAENYNS